MTTATMSQRLGHPAGRKLDWTDCVLPPAPLTIFPSLHTLTCLSLSLAHSAISLSAHPIPPSAMMSSLSGLLLVLLLPGRLLVPFLDQVLFFISQYWHHFGEPFLIFPDRVNGLFDALNTLGFNCVFNCPISPLDYKLLSWIRSLSWMYSCFLAPCPACHTADAPQIFAE